MDGTEKQQRLAETTLQQLEKMRRSGLFNFRRLRSRSVGPTVEQLAQREERIDVLTGRPVSEIEKRRRATFGNRETIELAIPDHAYAD